MDWASPPLCPWTSSSFASLSVLSAERPGPAPRWPRPPESRLHIWGDHFRAFVSYQVRICEVLYGITYIYIYIYIYTRYLIILFGARIVSRFLIDRSPTFSQHCVWIEPCHSPLNGRICFYLRGDYTVKVWSSLKKKHAKHPCSGMRRKGPNLSQNKHETRWAPPGRSWYKAASNQNTVWLEHEPCSYPSCTSCLCDLLLELKFWSDLKAKKQRSKECETYLWSKKLALCLVFQWRKHPRLSLESLSRLGAQDMTKRFGTELNCTCLWCRFGKEKTWIECMPKLPRSVLT